MNTFWQNLLLKFQDRRFRTIFVILISSIIIIFLVWFYYYKQRELPNITFSPNGQVPSSTKTTNNSGTNSPALLDQSYDLSIAKLNLVAPVTMDVDANNKDEYFKVLESGLAHMKGTAWPGEGNTVIFGHSSFYANQPGNYKTIFSTLDKLQPNDEIVLKSQSESLTYKVVRSEIITPDRVEVVAPTETKQLTLFTCWPPKTTTKRLVVVAALIAK